MQSQRHPAAEAARGGLAEVAHERGGVGQLGLALHDADGFLDEGRADEVVGVDGEDELAPGFADARVARAREALVGLADDAEVGLVE